MVTTCDLKKRWENKLMNKVFNGEQGSSTNIEGLGTSRGGKKFVRTIEFKLEKLKRPLKGWLRIKMLV